MEQPGSFVGSYLKVVVQILLPQPNLTHKPHPNQVAGFVLLSAKINNPNTYPPAAPAAVWGQRYRIVTGL